MPNSFKYSLSTETLSLRKDDFYLGTQTLSQQTGSERVSNRSLNSGNGRIAGWRADNLYRMPMNCAVFRVYNRELSASEVLNNYNQNRVRFL